MQARHDRDVSSSLLASAQPISNRRARSSSINHAATAERAGVAGQEFRERLAAMVARHVCVELLPDTLDAVRVGTVGERKCSTMRSSLSSSRRAIAYILGCDAFVPMAPQSLRARRPVTSSPR